MDGAVRTTCPYCGVGCGVLARPEGDGSVTIAGDPEHPANFGRLCSKGAALGETLSLDGRLLEPEVYGTPVGWDVALDHVADGFARAVAEHGPDSVALYGSGQLLTEDYYVANKLMKGFIGSANIDTNSRLCMASSVAGHKRAFGSDTVPGCYEDLEQADLIVLAGSNLAWCHPVLYQRIMAARAERPEMKLVVIDPRRTVTAAEADLHLPVSADGDSALFVGLLRALDKAGAIDREAVSDSANGVDEALAAASGWTLHRAANATGCARNEIARFFRMFEATERVVTIYSQGVNQSVVGTDKVNAIINCHLATGRIGQPGMGPFSVTGQPNAMGGREVGGLANMLAAHMDFTPEDIDRVRRFWDAPSMASAAGLKAVDLFEAVEAGKIRALWIMATNPVDSLPEADRFKKALAKCDLVVVSDMNRQTDTMDWADVRLPAAGWGEKDGTVTNSERRISRQRAFLQLPGAARPDWWIICQVAQRMGFKGFDHDGPAAIFAEHAALSALENAGTRDFDLSGLTGMSAGEYDTMAPVQWPVRGSGQGTARMFADGHYYSPDRRARLMPVSPAQPEPVPPGHMRLNTGRVRDHWHTMTRTGKSQRLSAHIAEPFAELHPVDAQSLGVSPASLVRIESDHGSILVRAQISDRQRSGEVFVPMHWTDRFAGSGRVDALVPARTDPHSGQPALKNASVRVEPVTPTWFGFAVARARPDLHGADYWALAEAEGGFRAELAGYETPADWDVFARSLFGLVQEAEALSFRDNAGKRFGFAAFEGEQLVAALFAGPEPVPVARQWAAGQLAESHEPANRAQILAGRAGADRPDGGAIVCACYQVGINTITEAVVSGACMSVEAVGAALRAGTNCGSCKGEIGAILDAHRRVAAE